MKIHPALAAFQILAAIALAVPGHAQAQAAPVSDYARFFDSFVAQEPDPARVTRVENLTLERPGCRITFTSGVLALGRPVEGRACALVFEGTGTFSFSPPDRIEREHVAAVFGSDSLVRPIATAVFLFADTTLDELARRQSFGRGVVSVRMKRQMVECMKYVSERKTRTLDPGIARPLLEGRSNGYCFGFLMTDRGERSFYEIDPSLAEDVMLWKEPKRRRAGFTRLHFLDLVSRFGHAGAGDPARSDATLRTDEAGIAVKRYAIESSIATNGRFTAAASLECESLEPGLLWIPFNLFERLAVDSVRWSDGPPAAFYRGRGGRQLWVRGERPIASGERRTLHVAYHGPLIENLGSWFFLRSPTMWYPRVGSSLAQFDLSFHVPSRYLLASVGRRSGIETRGGENVTRWETGRPVRDASFVLGRFREEQIGGNHQAPVLGLVYEGEVERFVIERSMLGLVRSLVVEPGKDDRALQEMARAAELYRERFGPLPEPALRLAETSRERGEAFAGLVNVGWSDFPDSTAFDEGHLFRAHAVAHEWWGHGVLTNSARDLWLAEGLAGISGLWSLGAESGGGPRPLEGSLTAKDEPYSFFLESWRQELLAGQGTADGARASGPIGLGAWTSSDEALDPFGALSFKKSVWVLHMIRMMLVDLESGDDRRFAKLLREFYRARAGTAVSTEDFRRAAETELGSDLGWFFDQWVHGAEIPTYRFAHQTERGADGKYHVTCRIEQSGVRPEFQAFVPLRLEFDGGIVTRTRLAVEGAVTEVQLPPSAAEPRRVVFNDLNAVLCRVDYVKW